MKRFFISPDKIKEGKAYFSEEEAHHIINVVRIKPGEKIVFFDGTGKEYSGIARLDRKGILFADITEERSLVKFKLPKITLAQTIIKKDKMDFIVQKATELNVDTIIPLITKRCNVKKNNDALSRYVNRWRKIAIEASKQCGRGNIPTVLQPRNFLDVVKGANKNYELSLLATLSGERFTLKDIIGKNAPSSIITFVGPEGDFSEEEIEVAQDFGLRPVNICPTVLRSETASIFILSVLNFAFLDSK